MAGSERPFRERHSSDSALSASRAAGHFGQDLEAPGTLQLNPRSYRADNTTFCERHVGAQRFLQGREDGFRFAAGARRRLRGSLCQIPSGEGPVTGTASARMSSIFLMLSFESSSSAAAAVPSRCSGWRAPTIATCTAG